MSDKRMKMRILVPVNDETGLADYITENFTKHKPKKLPRGITARVVKYHSNRPRSLKNFDYVMFISTRSDLSKLRGVEIIRLTAVIPQDNTPTGKFKIMYHYTASGGFGDPDLRKRILAELMDAAMHPKPVEPASHAV